jgi:hypothetical protein
MTARKLTTTVFAVAIALSVILVPASIGSGTTISQTVTATAHNDDVFKWTIDKSVTPDTWDLFEGDSGTSDYTVSVTKDSGTVHNYFDGQICVTNGGAEDSQNLTIVVQLKDGYEPPNDVIASAPVDVSGHPILAAGETHCYSYSIDVPSIDQFNNPQPNPGHSYKITANTTIDNHAPGTTGGPSTSASATFPSGPPTPVNDSISVDDDYAGSGSPWTFSASGSKQYSRTFSCDADKGTHDNTASISPASAASGSASDSASVTVNCHSLNVSKTASTSFTRKYNWTISKTASPAEKTIATGDSFSASYSVSVNASYADSNHAVSGSISVSNPAPIAATIKSVSDVVSNNGAASVDCGTATFPYTLAAGNTLNCTYSKSLPDADSETNTATATLQNHSYDSAGNPSDSGTTDFTGDAAVDFSSATITHVDKKITISDPVAGGTLGTAEYGVDSLPKTFPTYSQTIGPYLMCGDKAVKNTASFVGSDGATGSDTETVTAHVQCKLTVVKKLVPATDAGKFNLLIDNVAKAANVGDGGSTGAQQLGMGSHTVSETAGTATNLSEYVSKINCGGSDVSGTSTSVSFASGDSDKTCTITNTKKGRVTVKKTTDGAVNPTKSINFTLTGPGLPSGGVTLNTYGDADGVLDFGYALVPGSTYTICENPVPAGFTSFWKLDNVIVTPYNPNQNDSPPQDLGVRCYQFSASAAQTRAFDVDNSHPGGEPRTIGYWKNWNKCTGGNQAATAAKNGGPSAGVFVVDDLLPQTIGNFTVSTCAQAVKVLSKQDQSGTNRANDAAYELAAQLLAARFDLAAGAETCTAVQNAVTNAQSLLVSINFTGSGSYLTKSSTNRTNALNLATQLATYNMGNLC